MQRILVTRLSLLACLVAASSLFASITPAAALAQTAGDWQLTRARSGGSRDSVQLTITADDQELTSLPVPVSRLRGLAADALDRDSAPLRFEIASEAGTVSFDGRTAHGTASGSFRFAPHLAFAGALRAAGVTGDAETYDLLRLALRGVDTGYVQSVVSALRRYDDSLPSVTELVRFVNHGVDARTVADLGDAGLRGLAPYEVIRLVNHGVDGQYVARARAAGYDASDPELLIAAQKHGTMLAPTCEAGGHCRWEGGKHKDKGKDKGKKQKHE